jgi:AraC-like DNA-binding protein
MRQRMFASIQKLIYTDYDITQIAYAVGFNDSNYFSRCFKKFINMTPREYRMKYKSERASLPPEQDGGNTAGDEI